MFAFGTLDHKGYRLTKKKARRTSSGGGGGCERNFGEDGEARKGFHLEKKCNFVGCQGVRE